MAAFEIPYNNNQGLHKRVLDAVLERITLSDRKMRERYQHFSDMEEEFIAYIPETENDKLRKLKRKQEGLQTYTTLVVPYSYAVLMTAHMYWTSVFLSRSPIHQYQGRHGETELKVTALESLIDYQVTVGQMIVPYYIWLLDAGKYGMGVLGTYWSEEYDVVSEFVEEYPVYQGVPLITEKKQRVKVTKRLNTYSGNRAFNVRPQDFLPDPRVPITRFQDGEFCGRRTELGWNQILKRQTQRLYFNIGMLKRMRDDGTTREQGSPQIILPENTPYTNVTDLKDTGTVEIHEMTVELVPREWELGTGSYPEKWVFSIANKKLIIGAQPLGSYHNKFPYDVMEYEPDGYALFKRSLMEIVKPLGEVITWLFNSHFYNVRKVLNDQLIVDPSRLTMTDITNPNAGKVIRVKPSGYGQDVRTMLHQLNVVDVTRSHISDVHMVEQLVQRVSGVVDAVMGMPQQGGRRTATETRTTSGFSINRLKTVAEYMSAQGFAPHSQKLVQNTLQHYKNEKPYRITGSLAPMEDPYITVTPEGIAGAYDFVPVDGTLPVDKLAMMTTWNEILKGAAQIPGLLAGYDLNGIMDHIAQLGGIKTLKQFRIQVTPQDQIMQQMQAGNLIPMRGPNGRTAPNSGGTAGPGVGASAPSTLPGVGRIS